jgi:hypothetical protein
MVLSIVAGKTDIAQLSIIEIGKSLQRPSTSAPPHKRDAVSSE